MRPLNIISHNLSPLRGVSAIRLLLCILLLGGSLHATTTNLRGVVDAVEVQKKKKGAKSYRVRLRITWGHTTYQGEDETHTSITIHGKESIFLDGKPSTAAEALKVGHLVRIMGDVAYYACYSSDFEFKERVPDSFGPDSGVYRLRLPGAAAQVYLRDGKKETPYKLDLYLHLLCRKGAIEAAAGTVSDGHMKVAVNAPCLPVDVSGLSITDGRLRGSFSMTLLSASRWILKGEADKQERSFDIDAPLGITNGTGTFARKGQDEKKELQIRGSGEPVIPVKRTLWMRYNAPLGLKQPVARLTNHSGSLSLKMVDGQPTASVYTNISKGYPSGVVTACTLQWEGSRFSGTVDLHDKAHTGSITIEGVQIGAQLFGTCMTQFNGRPSYAGRLRGGLMEFDAPPVIGWPEGPWLKKNMKIVKTDGTLLPEAPVPDLK